MRDHDPRSTVKIMIMETGVLLKWFAKVLKWNKEIRKCASFKVLEKSMKIIFTVFRHTFFVILNSVIKNE